MRAGGVPVRLAALLARRLGPGGLAVVVLGALALLGTEPAPGPPTGEGTAPGPPVGAIEDARAPQVPATPAEGTACATCAPARAAP